MMDIFVALVRKDAESAYGIEFPDVPGCFSAADSADEIISNASEALELWFEGKSLIKPSDPSDIIVQVHEALEGGAFLIGVPFVRNTGKVVRVNVSIDQGVLDAIDQASKERGLTRSSFLAQASRNEIVRGGRG